MEITEALFIAMPSRKMKNICSRCHFKNEAGSRYCSHCGGTIPPDAGEIKTTDAKADYRDIAHPITQQFREYLQRSVLEAYKKEVATGERPGSLSEEVTSGVED